MAHYKELMIQILHIAHICENDVIQIKDMFQIVATWLHFSTEEYFFVLITKRGGSHPKQLQAERQAH